MDAKQFLAEFGHIVNAPEGVARLRDLVLELAIRGILTSPEKNFSSNAIELLKEIKIFRSDLVKKGELKRLSPLPGISKSEFPFKVPQNWSFERLGNICEIIRGVTFSSSKKNLTKSSSDVACLRTANIQVEINWNDLIYIDRNLVSHKEQWIEPGDIMISMANSYELVGKVALVRQVRELTTFGGFIAVIRPHVLEPEYLYLILRSPYMQISFRTNSSQTTNIANISLGGMRPILTPIPPKEEQSRIVAKVDELMALCDKLEAQQQERRKLQNALRQSTLQAVASAQSSQELQTSWVRLEATFGKLCSRPEDVDDFAADLKTIAVRGFLAESSSTLPAIDDIQRNCLELKNHYIANGIMRKQKPVSKVLSEENFPQHWAVLPFDETAIVIGGVTKGRDLRSKKRMTCPYLAVANVQRGYFNLDQLKTIQITEEELEKYKIHHGDLLITEGGDWDKVGRTAIWRGGVENCLHQNHIFKVRIPSEQLLNEWVELVFNSSVGKNYFANASKQTTNLASINMSQLRSFPLPIPPLDEQHLILGRLADLTNKCNQWRNQLDRKHTLASMMTIASVSALTGITPQKQEDEPVKIPQTELIAPLRLGSTPNTKAQAPLATILAHHHGEMDAKHLWQRFGGDIDAFYAQLKTEVAHGWIQEPAVAEMREKFTDATSG